MRVLLTVCALVVLIVSTGAVASAHIPHSVQAANDTLENGTGSATANTIGLGDTIQSELDTGDRYDESEFDGYYENYTFQGFFGDTISLEMRPEGGLYSTAHEAEIEIYGPDGEFVDGFTSGTEGYADSYDGGTEPDATIQLSKTGQYTIVASTDGAVTDSTRNQNPAYTTESEAHSATFAYELRLHDNLGDPTSLAYNSTTEGSLTTESNYNSDFDGYYEVYSFQGFFGDRVSLEMRPDGGLYSTEHEAELTVYGPDGEFVDGFSSGEEGYADSYDGGTEPDATIQLSKTGQYTVVASTDGEVTDPTRDADPAYTTERAAETATFDYQLRLRKSLGDAQSLAYNSTVNASLTSASHYNSDFDGYYDVYTFEGAAGDPVSLQMRPDGGLYSTEHEAELTVYGPDGEFVDGFSSGEEGYADSYDGGTEPDATVQLPEGGQYTVVASTDGEITDPTRDQDPAYTTEREAETATFDYQLRLDKSLGDAQPLTYNTTVNASLQNESDYNSDFDGYYDVYTFEGTTGDSVSLEMRPAGGPYATPHEAEIVVYGPEGEFVDGFTSGEEGYADSYEGTTEPDATIQLSETGQYTIVASTDGEVSDPTRDANPAYTTEREAETATFDYQLRLKQFLGDTTPLHYGLTVATSLTSASNYNDVYNGYYDVHTFESSGKDPVWLSMTLKNATAAQRHAARLEVYDPTGDRVEIDSPPTGNASIAGLDSSQPGTYTVVASSSDAGEDAAYQTAAKAANATFDYDITLTDGPNAAFSVSPSAPAVDEPLTFDATESSLPGGEIVSYEWDFDGDDEFEASGETVTQSFSSTGEQSVTLRVTADSETSLRDPIQDAVMERISVGEETTATLPGASGPARNIDDDDLLEDVNGDGQANIFDALSYYQNRNSQAITENPALFDFDDDGQAGTLFDTLALYEELS